MPPHHNGAPILLGKASQDTVLMCSHPAQKTLEALSFQTQSQHYICLQFLLYYQSPAVRNETDRAFPAQILNNIGLPCSAYDSHRLPFFQSVYIKVHHEALRLLHLYNEYHLLLQAQSLSPHSYEEVPD